MHVFLESLCNFFTHTGVTQSMLETVVPRAPNAAVMLVGGKRKGQVKGNLSSPIKCGLNVVNENWAYPV